MICREFDTGVTDEHREIDFRLTDISYSGLPIYTQLP